MVSLAWFLVAALYGLGALGHVVLVVTTIRLRPLDMSPARALVTVLLWPAVNVRMLWDMFGELREDYRDHPHP